MANAFNLDRLRKPSRANNLRRHLVESKNPRTDKPRKGFETSDDKKREVKKRVGSLKRYARKPPTHPGLPGAPADALVLASLLRTAVGKHGAATFADPRFMSEVRRCLGGEIVRQLRRLRPQDVTFYHIASENWRLPGDELATLSPKRLMESLRANLTRYGGLAHLSGWAAVFFHNEHDKTEDQYQPHFHAVVVGKKRRAFEALRELDMFQGGKGQAIYRPIQAQESRDLIAQVSYLMKTYWPGKSSYLNSSTGSKRRPKTHHRIPEPRHAEALVFLGRLRFSDIVWLHGVEIKNGRVRLR